VGSRMKIGFTRSIINAVLNGDLKNVPMTTEPFFGLQIPKECPGVPADILNTRNTWSNQADYDAQAKKLAGMFVDNLGPGQAVCG